tara:strand:+ start:162 stop:779 length:618 start_codon:yes stop_codon:yes gene_type:complete
MTDFHDVRFPLDVSFGSRLSVWRETEIATLASGREERSTRWADSRIRLDAGLGVRTLDQLADVLAFYEARLGPLYGFRVRNFLDCKSCGPTETVSPADQVLGTGTGSKVDFNLHKKYADDVNPYTRFIKHPVAGALRVAVDAVEVFDWTFADGVVTFDDPPADGAAITSGFEFDFPMRFESTLDVDFVSFRAGQAPAIPLIELKG